MSAAVEAPTAIEEIDRAWKTFGSLPEVIDLRLQSEGIRLETSDFTDLILKSSGLDLRRYFVDALSGADFLSQSERAQLSADLFRIFDTVSAFSSGSAGAVMHRTERTFIQLPEALTQGFVQQMSIDRQVKFALKPVSEEETTFVDIDGITFNVGGKILALRQLNLKAEAGFCVIKPLFDEQGVIPQQSPDLVSWLKSSGKDLLVGVMVKAQQLSTKLPVVMEEFRQYLEGAMSFRELLRRADKDLVTFFEKTSGASIEDPLTRSLLSAGKRITKRGHVLELHRTKENICDFGGVALRFDRHIKLHFTTDPDKLDIDKVGGVGLQVPFEAPPELKAVGCDLRRSVPNCITSLKLSLHEDAQRCRLVAGTTPGCWVGVDLTANMQPLIDSDGNWLIFGVTLNPISASPQKFFLRLDSQNNLSMTPREITEMVTETAIEGFDPNNPFTWSWAAVALGGKTLLVADTLIRDGSAAESIKRGARKLGRFLGRILND